MGLDPCPHAGAACCSATFRMSGRCRVAAECLIDTAVGKIKFAKNGEWEKDRILYVQYRGIEGSDLDQWRKAGRALVLWPLTLKSGDLKYPYSTGKM